MSDPSRACCAGVRRLYRTDVYALHVKAIHLHQPDEVAAPAAKVDDGSGRGWRQHGTAVALVDKSSRLVSAATGAL